MGKGCQSLFPVEEIRYHLKTCGIISKLAGFSVTVPMKLRLQAGMTIYRDGALFKSFFPRCRWKTLQQWTHANNHLMGSESLPVCCEQVVDQGACDLLSVDVIDQSFSLLIESPSAVLPFLGETARHDSTAAVRSFPGRNLRRPLCSLWRVQPARPDEDKAREQLCPEV